MTTPFPFVASQVLTAQQLNDIQNLPISDKTASYVLIAGDETKRTIMNAAGATTITVNNSIYTVGDVIQIANKGNGITTITAGAGVTINTSGSLALGAFGGGYLLCISASTFTFFSFAAKNTLAVEFLLVGGGAGGGSSGQFVTNGHGGGGAGGFVEGSGIIGKTSYTVKVGAGGAATSTNLQGLGRNGTASSFIGSANGGGGGAGASTGAIGASGGGGSRSLAGGVGISGEGNAGGSSGADTNAGGGGSFAGVGSNGLSTAGGNGGAASTNAYNGVSTSYSGGGGGGGSVTGGTAGTNAGNGGGNTTGSNATANRGGGGGGSYAANASGAGGSGRVIIRYLTANATGLTITSTGSPTTGTDGSYSFLTYDATGSITVA